jgi:L-asparagine transporter-like permease
MSLFSLRGLDVNKEVINIFSAVLVIGLTIITALGFVGVGKKGGLLGVPKVTEQSFVMSVLFFYFILAGFDALIKFSEETKDSKDVSKSFYISNGISIFLTLGLCLAFVSWVNIKKLDCFENGVGAILDSLLGGNISTTVMICSVVYMMVTTFVAFLATTRYIYGLAEHEKALKPLRKLNEKNAPENTIWLTTGLAALGIMVNHTEYLVRFADFGLSTLLLTMGAAATKLGFLNGQIPITEAATTAAFAGLMGISFMK